MSFRDRLIRILGGDEPAVDPEQLVALVEVRHFEAPLVIEALRAAEIPASAVEEISARYTGERLFPHATIWVAAGRRTQALEIINDVVGFDGQ
jgi:hypothetical protein